MNTATLEERSAPRRREFPFARLVLAEILKLRRRYGLMGFATLLTIVPMVIGYGITGILHSTDPSNHGPAGGLDNLSGSLQALQALGGVAALLIGATLGAGDLGAGVFRELVVTGRSRIALFAARIPAGIAVLMAFVIVAFLIAAVGSVILAGPLASPSTGLLVRSFAWIAVSVLTDLLLAIGVASLIGSRSTAIGVLLAWHLAVAPLLLAFGFLGSSRAALLPAATTRLAPAALNIDPPISISLTASTATITLWMLAAVALGGWRTATRDA